jgi:hypothetical protein
MNSKRPLFHVPVPSTDFATEATMCGSVLRFGYQRDEVAYRSGIRFNNVLATRTRAERCCRTSHIESVYDTLAEIEGSSWVEEIRADTAERWRNEWETHHYMIYLDSAGCFEVIAASWDVKRKSVRGQRHERPQPCRFACAPSPALAL